MKTALHVKAPKIDIIQAKVFEINIRKMFAEYDEIVFTYEQNAEFTLDEITYEVKRLDNSLIQKRISANITAIST